MEPGTSEASAELDTWYREEHNEQMSLEPGWLRSTRYKLSNEQNEIANKEPQVRAPLWLAIHEFGEGNKLGSKVEPLIPMTPWTKKVMSDMTNIEANVWIKIAAISI
jgi:hypothetical protein